MGIAPGAELDGAKEVLKAALVESKRVKYCDHVEASGKEFYEAAKKNNLEGIMAKRKDSTYRDGVRNEDWVKIKSPDEEAIIVGFTEPRGSRDTWLLILGKFQRAHWCMPGTLARGSVIVSSKRSMLCFNPW